MTTDYLDYTGMLEEAHRLVVRRTLAHVAEHGLPGEHHFYIAFRTDAPDVELPEFLLAKYPEEMTIVIQNDFWGLEVEEEVFCVQLHFDGQPTRLVIPYSAIIGFLDPSVQFGIQFDLEEDDTANRGAPAVNMPPEATADSPPKAAEGAGPDAKETGEVIALDRFRKK